MRPLGAVSFSIALGILFAATVPARAQTNAAEQTAPQPTVRTTTNLVLVDVVVTDHDGAVHGLERGRFHVFEDGREQAISSFEEHVPGTAAPALFSRAGLPPHTYTNAPDYPPASAVNVLLLDGLNTSIGDQMTVRRKMLDYLGRVKPGTPLAIFTLSTRLRMVTSFTNDPAALLALMKKPKTNPQQSPALATPADAAPSANAMADVKAMQVNGPPGLQNLDNSVTLHNSGPVSALDAMQQFETDFTAADSRMRAELTLDAMQQLAQYLGGREGRKNVIWFSGAFPFAFLPDANTAFPFKNVETFRHEIEKTADLLSAARVAIYPVDAGGLWVEPQLSAATVGVPSYSAGATAREQKNAGEATMQELAEETGGKAYIENNQIDKCVADAVENGSSYYTIAYAPQMGNQNNQFRSIRVKVDDDRGMRLEYRRGYYTEAPQQGAEPGAQQNAFATAIAPDAPESPQILLKARVLAASDPACQGMPQAVGPAAGTSPTFKGAPHRYVVDVTIDAHGLVFETTPEGDRKGAMELAMIAYSPDGQRLNSFVKSSQIALKAAMFEKVMAAGITVRLPFDLPAGKVSVRIGVHDLNADRTGTLDVPLTVEQ